MNYRFYLVITFFYLSSCSTNLIKEHHKINFEEIIQIKLGESKDQVFKKLGNPNEVNLSADNKKILLDYYKSEESKSIRASIVLDENRKVISKTFVPNDDEQLVKLEYVKNSLFGKNQFIEFLNPHCLTHAPSSEGVLVDIVNGIAIHFVKKDSEILFITWLLNSDLKLLTDKWSQCKPK
jgi:hypothetical protein